MPTDRYQNPAIQCHGITKTYGTGSAQVRALRGVDLEIQQGELFMLMGPSGCGKTTLLSIITGILDPDQGQCEVLGHDLKTMSPKEKAQFRSQSVGFVFQVFNLLPSLSAIENVAIPLLLNGVSRKQARARAQHSLESVGLGERLDALPSQLSGGQQQRVAIARALVHNPDLIVCDEPTSNLDHKMGQAMMKILQDVVKNPERVLIVVSHDTRILEFADRVAYMDDGKIQDVMTGKEVERLK